MKSLSVKAKLCRVCGDKATAYNFRGLSCDSCKIFFRRNATTPNKFECYFEGNCSIDKVTRKYCPKCRLAKCFAIGMEVRWTVIPTTMDNIQPVPVVSKDSTAPSTATDSTINSISENIPIIDSIDLNPDTTLHSILEPEVEISEESDVDQIMDVDRAVRPAESELTSCEWATIAELQRAMAVFENENTLPVAGKAAALPQAFHFSNHYIRRVVRFCKQIGAFRSLDHEDQFDMLRCFYTEIHAIRFAFNYHQEGGGVRMIENESGNRVILFTSELFRDQSVVSRNKQFMCALHEQLENDATLRDLVIAHHLFKPRENLASLEPVTYHHCAYRFLLQRYLAYKYGSVKVANTKIRLLMRVLDQNLAQMREDLVQLFSQTFHQQGCIASSSFSSSSFSTSSDTTPYPIFINNIIAEAFSMQIKN